MLEQGGNQNLYISSMIADSSAYFSKEEGREKKREEDSTPIEAMTFFFVYSEVLFRHYYLNQVSFPPNQWNLKHSLFVPVIGLSITIYFLYSLLLSVKIHRTK